MSVNINLLPEEERLRARERRRAGITTVVVLLFAVALGGIYFLKDGAVDNARERRDAAQQQVAELRAEVASLQQFADLAAQLQTGNDLLAFAMGGEVSVARLLNDLALSFPSSASLTNFTMELLGEQDAAQAGEIDPGAAVAAMTYTGYSVERFAPGVEVVLLDLSRIPGLTSTFLQTAADTDIGDVGVTNFDGRARLDERVRTGRYADGLPEALQ